MHMSSNESPAPAKARKQKMRIEIYSLSLLTGILAGLVVVAYRFAISAAEEGRASFLQLHRTSPPHLAAFFFVLACAGAATFFMTRARPLIKGSGIPQVKAFLLRRVNFDWKRELPFKFTGGVLALGAGLSLGREGPSIQLGALTGKAVEEIAHKPEYQRYLITAGAAAGISAAFNAPLAAVLFCVEELHRNISPVMLTSALIASFSANLIMWIFAGNAPIFGIELINVLPISLYVPAILAIGIVTGILGALFNHGLIRTGEWYKKLLPQNVTSMMLAFLVGGLVCILLPEITGGGNSLINQLNLDSFTFVTLIILLAAKFGFTLFSYASGAPGGIFLPMLALGALIGSIANRAFVFFNLPDGYLPNYLLLGMAGFFVAVVRAPITGAVLITEMAGSFSHFPAFIFVSVLASLTASLLKTPPIYDMLLAKIPASSQNEAHVSSAEAAEPVVLHIPLQEGCLYTDCAGISAHLPAPAILSGILRGEDELFPEPDLKIHAGDIALVLVPRYRAHQLKESLLELGKSAAFCPDSDEEI